MKKNDSMLFTRQSIEDSSRLLGDLQKIDISKIDNKNDWLNEINHNKPGISKVLKSVYQDKESY